MKKKTYMTPEITVINVETAQMIAYSGGDQQYGIVIDNEPDQDASSEQMSREMDGLFSFE